MDCSQDEVRVKMVSLKGFSHCTLENCEGGHGQQEERNVQYLKMEARFTQLDERIDHMADRPDMAMIKVFEVNYRTEPKIESVISGQLIEGDVVNVMNRQGDWVKVQCGTRIGWVDQGSLYFYKEIVHHQQLKGETQVTYICEACTEAFDWRDVYRREIEEKQVGHVVSNYTFDYVEMALAMEEGAALTDGLVDKKLLVNRICEELESGNHGMAKRFDSTKIVNHLLRHRPAC